jgi:hypothetical protein
MDDSSEKSWMAGAGVLARALRPAVPAVIGAAALTFLFAAVMPLAWVASISWNLYLDRLSDLFVPPVGGGGRLALALVMAAVAAVIAGLVALALARPDALRRRRRRDIDSDVEDVLPRRRADLHPDDPPRPPLRAGRDLPPQGLDGVLMPSSVEADPADAAEEAFEFAQADEAAPEDELMLADVAPVEPAPGDEPWLQPAEIAAPATPDPADQSLGAMVARFEAGLARRRDARSEPALPTGNAANEDDMANIDFALEAALGTLQRLNRQAVG